MFKLLFKQMRLKQLKLCPLNEPVLFQERKEDTEMILGATWVAQMVECLPSAQVMVLGSSSESGSLLNG